MGKTKPLSKLPAADRSLVASAVLAIESGDLAALASAIPQLVERGLLNYPKAATLDRTLLHIAVAQRNVHAAAILLDAGADINAGGYQRVTPLMEASSRDLRLTEYLLSRKADTARRDAFGRNALHHAAGSILADVEILSMLLAAGADPNGKDTSGRTPLHSAVAVVDPRKVKLLLERGADRQIRARGMLGTALEYLDSTVRDLPTTAPGDREKCVALLSG